MNSLLLLCLLQYSAVNGLDPNLVASVMKVESNGNTKAKSNKNAHGLLQVRKLFVAQSVTMLQDPCVNLALGTDLLRKAIKSCKGLEKGLVCYNRGVRGSRSIIAKTDRYVNKVRRAYGKINVYKNRIRIPYK